MPACGTVLLAAAAAAAAGRAGPEIERLDLRQDGPRVLVSYRVERALPDETLERIRSGIPVRFRHRVEVVENRAFPLFPDRVVARTRVETRVTFDSLTRRYDLERDTVDGEDDAVHAHAETESEDEMRRWMTEVHDLSVAVPPGDRPRRLRVRVALGRHYVWLVFPTTLDASADWPLEGE